MKGIFRSLDEKEIADACNVEIISFRFVMDLSGKIMPIVKRHHDLPLCFTQSILLQKCFLQPRIEPVAITCRERTSYPAMKQI